MSKLIYLVNGECRIETQILTIHISPGNIPRYTTLTAPKPTFTPVKPMRAPSPLKITLFNDFPSTHKPNLASVSYC